MNKKFALCVGNNYPGTGADLGGCVNDALDWSEMLMRLGYEVTAITEADKTSTLAHLTEMVAKAGWADRVVFTFSGHGTWVPDRNGDEADGRDEALVMAGLTYNDLILDDHLQEIFSNLRPGTGALVLSDSCHSGTVSRFNSPTARVDGKPRFVSPVDLDMGISFERVVELEERVASVPRRAANLISGCADHEYSYDAVFSGRGNGAFSRAAIDTYMKGMTLNHWFHAIRQILPTAYLPQSPQMTATAYRKYTRAL